MARASKIPRSLSMELGSKRTTSELLKESSSDYHRVVAHVKFYYRIINVHTANNGYCKSKKPPMQHRGEHLAMLLQKVV